MKVCSDCKAEKPLEAFGKDKNRPDGMTYSCLPCKRKAKRESDERHRERVRADNRERMRQARDSKPEVREKERLASEKYRRDNAETLRVKERERAKTRYHADPAGWYAKSLKQRAAKIHRTIKLSLEHEAELKRIYASAKHISEKTEILHHVDHIVPLQGKMMSGLHVPWNLEVVPARENLAKSNKVDYSRALPTCMDRVDA